MQQLLDTVDPLTALSSLDLGCCDSLQQLPDTIGQLAALRSLDLGAAAAWGSCPTPSATW
jgi:hypothetical protein